MEKEGEIEERSGERDRNSTEIRKWSKTQRPAERTDREEEKQQTDRRKKTKSINIGTFNIIDGRANRVKMACWHLDRHNVDICFLTETKLDGHHTTSTHKPRVRGNYTRRTIEETRAATLELPKWIRTTLTKT